MNKLLHLSSSIDRRGNKLRGKKKLKIVKRSTTIEKLLFTISTGKIRTSCLTTTTNRDLHYLLRKSGSCIRKISTPYWIFVTHREIMKTWNLKKGRERECTCIYVRISTLISLLYIYIEFDIKPADGGGYNGSPTTMAPMSIVYLQRMHW